MERCEKLLSIGFSDPYDFHRTMMRRKHGFCGPYRLGVSVGFYGDDLPAPYTHAQTIKSYEQGVSTGKQYAVEGRVLYPTPGEFTPKEKE